MSRCGNYAVGNLFLIHNACFASLMTLLAEWELMAVIGVACSVEFSLLIIASLH